MKTDESTKLVLEKLNFVTSKLSFKKFTVGINLKILVLFLLGQTCLAYDFSASLNQESQFFYLNPPSSEATFGRLTLQNQGSFALAGFDLKADSKISFDESTTTNQQTLFNPQRFGLLKSTQYFDLFIGGLTVPIKGTDLNNIFDVAQGKDYRQPFNTQTVGSFAVQLEAPIGALTTQIFYIPKNRRSLLPNINSPWWPRTSALPLTQSSGTFYLPEKMSYQFASESELNKPFDNNFGLMSQYSFSSLDLQFFYFSGANQLPQISPHVNIDITSYDPLVGVINPPVDLNLLWYKSEHIGLGLTSVLFDWIAKANCKKQTDFLVDNQNSNACTFTIENSLSISRFSLRYFVQLNRSWKKTESSSELETLLGFFEKSTALGLYLDLEKKGVLTGALIYNEKNPSTLAHLSYDFKWTEKFKTTLALSSIFSSGGVLAEAYKKTNTTSLILNYDF